MKPRSKNKVQVDYTIDDIYKYYNELHKDDELKIDATTFKKVLYSFNKKILNAIVEGSETFKIPKRLGLLRVKKVKMSFKDGASCKIDWAMTKKYGKTIYHMNDHTGNYRYRFYWQKSTCNAINKTAYSFEATRYDKRKLARLLKNHVTDYYL
jgi:hypothetical protein